jgi:hypothetical protein
VAALCAIEKGVRGVQRKVKEQQLNFDGHVEEFVSITFLKQYTEIDYIFNLRKQ